VLLGLFLATPAMAALTIAWDSGYPIVTGNKKEAVVTITFDSSYATGGESFTAADLGFTKFDFVSDAIDTVKTYVVAMKYDYTNSKIIARFVASGDTAIAYRQPKATANLALCTAKFRVIGN
jgi:hypothetical protein